MCFMVSVNRGKGNVPFVNKCFWSGCSNCKNDVVIMKPEEVRIAIIHGQCEVDGKCERNWKENSRKAGIGIKR